VDVSCGSHPDGTDVSALLIVAPYNAQVFELQERLPGARVGIVDKFQGQQAPIVIYSMTTSSHADAPRGMEFLYSLKRLNVATSRAMCLCVPGGRLLQRAIPECRSTAGRMQACQLPPIARHLGLGRRRLEIYAREVNVADTASV
jgi:AAA domain